MKASENTHNLPPFPAFPCVTRYVPVGPTADALTRIRRSIKSADGVSLVIGPPGTGKSLVCRIVADEFRQSHDVVLLGDAPIDDQADFHRHILHRLGVELDSVVDGDLHLALIDRVCGKESAQNGLLIVVDEAQCLSTEVLEAIRMVTNIMHNDQPRVTAVVCGGVKLDDTLTAPSLEPFTQRVSTRCYLHPLNAAETREYVGQAIRACESDPEDTITDEAVGAIHHACSGVPRLINQIMTEAIDCAAENDQDYICEKMVDLAWAQLQQLPSPMVEEPKIVHNTSPVEFGSLSDLDSPSETESGSVGTSETDEVPTTLEVESVEPEPQDQATESCSAGESCSTDCQSTEETIQWAEEPADEDSLSVSSESFRDVPAVEPLPAALFGDFELEETVTVGNGVRGSATGPNDSTAELETMIHSEIVSLSELAEDARKGCIEGESHEIVSLENTPQPVIWLDEPEAESTTEPVVQSDDIVLSTGNNSDDSDLLVIEEDIEVAPEPQVTRVDGQSSEITVDFHALLSSMRKTS